MCDDIHCEFCNTNKPYTFYEAWFYTEVRNNPYAKGTASAGLMQLRIACKECLQEAIDNDMTPVKEIK